MLFTKAVEISHFEGERLKKLKEDQEDGKKQLAWLTERNNMLSAAIGDLVKT